MACQWGPWYSRAFSSLRAWTEPRVSHGRSPGLHEYREGVAADPHGGDAGAAHVVRRRPQQPSGLYLLAAPHHGHTGTHALDTSKTKQLGMRAGMSGLASLDHLG